MLVRKLAGLFALMAVGTYLSAWMLTRHTWPNKPTMTPDEALAWAVCVAVIFFFVGLFLATLGLGLMQEVLAERRSRELERLFYAKMEYNRVVKGADAPSPAADKAGVKPEGANA